MDWRGAAKGRTQSPSPSNPLRDRLAEIRENSTRLIGPDRLAPVERAIRELEQSEFAAHRLAEGAEAPSIELSNQHGQSVRSRDLVAAGPLIVVFYRGRWCPYCMTTLEAWQQSAGAFQEIGAEVIAISPQKSQHTFFTADQHGIRYHLLSDPGNKVARQFGLVYRVPTYLENHYRRIFINLENCNGDASWELPVPATYVLSTTHRVLFSQAFPDFRYRDEPAEVLKALEAAR